MPKENKRSEFFLDDAFFLDDGKDLINEMTTQEKTIIDMQKRQLEADTAIELLKEDQIEHDDFELERFLSLSLTSSHIEDLREHFQTQFGYHLSTGIRTVIIEYMKKNNIF